MFEFFYGKFKYLWVKMEKKLHYKLNNVTCEDKITTIRKLQAISYYTQLLKINQ